MLPLDPGYCNHRDFPAGTTLMLLQLFYSLSITELNFLLEAADEQFQDKMAENMKIPYLSISNIAAALIAMLLILQSPHLLASDPPENIRFEDGLLRWDAVDGAISYNIYALSSPVNGNGFYVTTVEDALEYQTTFSGFYTVVAFFGGAPEQFSAITDSELVEGGDGPLLGFDELAAQFFSAPATDSGSTGDSTILLGLLSEVRTNRCTDVITGEGCAVMCDDDEVSIATGGACRADSAIILHGRATNRGYECLATADAAYVEVDAICLFPDNF